jgi:hypothetical protein
MANSETKRIKEKLQDNDFYLDKIEDTLDQLFQKKRVNYNRFDKAQYPVLAADSPTKKGEASGSNKLGAYSPRLGAVSPKIVEPPK